MAHILIIEDDSSINSMLRDALGNSGYTCAFSSTEGLLLLEREQFDLILLNLMLPGMRGDEVLRRGRQLTQAPFLVLSAVDSLESKVELLTLGADDYITKPFEIEELRARVLVQLRKHQSPAVQITVGELTLEPALHRIIVCGKEPSLTAREYRILELLMKNPTKIFSKQEIYESAWDSYYMGEDKTINVHISNIRQKLRRYTEQEYIETVWGIGFRMTQA